MLTVTNALATKTQRTASWIQPIVSGTDALMNFDAFVETPELVTPATHALFGNRYQRLMVARGRQLHP
jgi:hypothetical protein